ncbi:zinc finger CCCH domain-containing protein 18-like [Andrographis paniculata]|uniref:zinc finger CCCH domain-containing protein 18-like n=1 Tax=Andrographis paniculata TaxID=175694 RepID=UPI0021E76643|nr:zinc finger CCCH domain-containing protein 18-like [Andrographis paniculata]
MDIEKATKIVLAKLSSMQPSPVVKKVLGYIYFKELSNTEMIRLAMGPDILIHGLIYKAMNTCLVPINHPTPPLIDPTFHIAHLPPSSSYAQALQNQSFDQNSYFKEQHQMIDPLKYSRQAGAPSVPPGFAPEMQGSHGVLPLSPRAIDYARKTCHYFLKGNCKHGRNCRYRHGEESCGYNQFNSESLEKIEIEIVKLLESKGGPVSIASLPLLYFERYGRPLQAEGYLTESQRQRRSGHNLLKFLLQLNKSICIIERPHGQHDIVLAKDAGKYIDIRGSRCEPDTDDCNDIVTSSHQIYMTFPPESTFTEDDIAKYFREYGAVRDVRIPCQQRRMFGFVTFESTKTVEKILAKKHPHFVCGARIVVKPYQEKFTQSGRKSSKNYVHQMYYLPESIGFDAENYPKSSSLNSLLQRQLMEDSVLQRQVEQEQEQRDQMMHLGISVDTSNTSIVNVVNYMLDIVSSSSTGNDDMPKLEVDMDSSHEELNLPDSPFAQSSMINAQ